MKAMVRLLTALLAGLVVLVVGVLVFNALDVGGIAWLGLLLVATIVTSLVDHERFYGFGELAESAEPRASGRERPRHS